MYCGHECYWLTNPSFTGRIVESLLHRLEVRVANHYNPRLSKQAVFNRLRQLQAEGYVDDVAFVMAMREAGHIGKEPYIA